MYDFELEVVVDVEVVDDVRNCKVLLVWRECVTRVNVNYVVYGR